MAKAMREILKKSRNIFSLLVLMLLCLVAVLWWTADPWFLSAPNDVDLRAEFMRKRSEFDGIRRMLTVDGITYLRSGHHNERIPNARQAEYDRLLRVVDEPIVRSDGNVSKFIYASGGLFSIGPGWQKGIQYGSDGCGEMVASLDNPRNLDSGIPYCKKIEEEWFLMLEKFD